MPLLSACPSSAQALQRPVLAHAVSETAVQTPLRTWPFFPGSPSSVSLPQILTAACSAPRNIKMLSWPVARLHIPWPSAAVSCDECLLLGFFMAVPWRPKPANVHTWTNYVRIVSGCAVWKHAFSHFSGSAWLPSQYSSCVARCVSEEAVVLLIALQLSDNLSLRAHTVDTDLRNMSGVRWLKEMVSTHAPVKNPRKICFQYPMDSNGISKRPGKPRVQRTYRFWVGLKQVWNLYETLNISICPHLPPSLARLISSWMPQWPAAHRARKAAQQTSQDLSSTLNLWYAYTPKKLGFQISTQKKGRPA